MAGIPSKVEKRMLANIKEIQNITKKAKEFDVSETQTVSDIVKPFLSKILGYDTIEDITDQLPVRGTYCDIAIKYNNKPYIILEAKAVGVPLKDMHLKQAKDYGVEEGVEWIILTNGTEWKVYKIIFKQPVTEELVTEFNLIELNFKKEEDKKKVFCLCKEAISKSKSEIENLYNEKKATSKYVIGNLLFKKEVVSLLRKELKKLSPNANIEPESISNALKDVVRREILEEPEGVEAKKKIDRLEKKSAKSKESLKSGAEEVAAQLAK